MEKIDWIKTATADDMTAHSKNFWKHLEEFAYPLSGGKTKIPISLEPFALSHQKYHILQSQVALLISAAKKLAEEFYYDTELEKVFAVNEQERAIIIASKNDALIGIVRVDLFYGESPKVIEINADFPDGFFMHDVTASAIANLPHGHNLLTASNSELFIELLRSQKVRQDDHIFIGYNGDRQFLDEFALTKIKLGEAGWSNISVGAFENLQFIKGAFYFNNKQVKVIRRGAEMSKLRVIPGFFDQLATAKRTSGLKVINPFKMRLLGHKSLLAALHDRRFAKYLTSDELAAVEYLVPKTMKFETASANLISQEKDRWVLKPSDLAEGHGVTIGSSASGSVWAAALETASQEPHKWILQEKINIPSQTFTLLDGDTHDSTTTKAFYDFDPHVVLFGDHSKFGNVLVRFSSSEILNIMQGGGLTYAFHHKE